MCENVVCQMVVNLCRPQRVISSIVRCITPCWYPILAFSHGLYVIPFPSLYMALQLMEWIPWNDNTKQAFSFMKIHIKMALAKCLQLFSVFNVLTTSPLLHYYSPVHDLSINSFPKPLWFFLHLINIGSAYLGLNKTAAIFQVSFQTHLL